jgi:hypothetical protein
MTQQQTASLQDIALDIVAKYNAAGKHLVGAWSTGTQNALRGVAARTPAAPTVIGERVASARQAFQDFWTDTLQKDAAQAIKLMDMVADRAADGIQSLAATAERVQDERGAALIKTLDTLNLPLAQFSLKIADSIATGAEKLEARVAGGAESAKEATTVQAKVHSTPAVAKKD